MLTRRTTLRPQTPACVLYVTFLVVFLFALAVPPPVRADLPTVIENPDASRTITWNTTTDASLVLQNASISNGRAVLAWQTASINWLTADQFLSNGTADANVSVVGSGLELGADTSPHVVNGDFATNDRWIFADGPTGNVTATWDSNVHEAVLGHDSLGVSEASWDNLDTTANWTYRASPGVFGGIKPETSLQREGAGAVEVNLTMPSGSGLYAGALRSSWVDWSRSDRLLIWALTVNVNSPLSFNVTALVGSAQRTTTTQPLLLGWQELVVNLDQLGTAGERTNLQNVLLRINGQNVPTTSVYFDDARLANAKVFADSASVSQAFVKENVTTPDMGSAILTFDWVTPDAAGVRSVTASVSVSGSSSFERTFAAGPSGSWQSLGLDVSSWTTTTGTYTLTFRFEVAVDNTSVSTAHLRIDNVSVVFPNRGNGTYLSDAVPLGVASQFLTVTWTASSLAPTSITLGLRSGNNSSPASATWSSWQMWTFPGPYSVSLPGARYVQVRVDLGTTNASLSPRMSTMILETRHRAAEGSVIAKVFHVAAPDFLGWRSFTATLNRSAGTSITFYIGNGSYWTPVASMANISGFAGTNISWEAVLQTVDGLQTPVLSRVDAVYEFLGDIVNVFITPFDPPPIVSGHTFKFQARAGDAGNHMVPVPVFSWDTDDRDGSVGGDGTYRAGTPGPHIVTATVPGLGIFGIVHVTVLEAPLLPAELSFLPYALLVIAAIGSGYALYEISIRRMFAIDDIFLISKDGRLMIHNTRRMRADRDEDILSGMLTAILTFLRDFDREENGDVGRFDVGGKTALLERGDHAYLAAVYSGRVPRWAGKDLGRFMRDLEVRFGEAFARWTGSPEDLQGLREFTGRFVSRVRYRPPRGNHGLAG